MTRNFSGKIYSWKIAKIGEGESRRISSRLDLIRRATFIFADASYMCPSFYTNMMKIAKCVTFNQAKGIFGFTGDSNIGQIGFPPVQKGASFTDCFRTCLG